ncbi:unnamed protein product [Parajaminaea phylloscopi]
MPPKRPHPNVFGDEDSYAGQPKQQRSNGASQNASAPSAADGHGSKRPKMTPSMLEGEASAGKPAPPPTSAVQAQIAAARARIDAQMAALKSRQNGAQAGPSTTTSARPPAAKSATAPPARPPAASTSQSAASSLNMDSIKKKIAEAKAKAAALSANRQPSAPSRAVAAATEAPPRESSQSGIHPLLMSSGPSSYVRPPPTPGSAAAAKARYGSRVPDGTAVPVKANPYLSTAAEQDDGPGAAGSSQLKGRSMHRQLQFNRAGRHVRAAEESRREAQLEALKKRIAESAKKAGLHEELTGEERRIKRQPPPDVEWWDASLLPQGSYSCVPAYPPSEAIVAQAVSNTPATDSEGSETTQPYPLVLSEGTPIDPYIQHPIPIPDPTEKFRVQPKGVMLTKQEMRKMRKQRRAAELQDKQDRIKMGLQVPDPPKVKLSNLMRVLTSEQVADPTKIEAKVRREVAARKEQHERTNAERALTDEQRRAKIAQKKDEDEAKGLYVAVYKIKHLVSPSHKFKVRKNATQDGLTGLTVFHPDFALIVVEGPSKGMRHYKKLMLHRIRWDDPGRPNADGGSDDESRRPAFLGPMGDAPPVEQPAESLDDIEWSTNTCELIFEGPARARQFATGIRARTAADDYEAREILGPQWAGYWDVARKMQAAREEAM